MAELGPCPSRFTEIKEDIAKSFPDFQQRLTASWTNLLAELEKATEEITTLGSKAVPEVEFSQLGKLSAEDVEAFKKKGCIVIHNVVDDAEAISWREDLKQYVKKNPVEGIPEEDKQFFQLYWTKSQVRARAHPNVLAASSWLNTMYHVKTGGKVDNVDLSTPLSYADRFRIRHPGNQWNGHPPHVDGGSIERWEDKIFRTCFADILSGNWPDHDPYDLEGRINARSSLYGRPGQSTVFRTYQGWLALSETAPHEGTLKVFPSVILSNSYTIMRPFFRFNGPDNADLEATLDPKNWVYDTSHPDFPGIYSQGPGFTGPRPNTSSHPHLRLDDTMVSVPKVYPGDMVFWHCDVIHSVEVEHVGKEDSCVMYIPAVPFTPANAEYVKRQRETFLKGATPPDFPDTEGEGSFVGVGQAEDIVDPVAKRAMGFVVEVA